MIASGDGRDGSKPLLDGQRLSAAAHATR